MSIKPPSFKSSTAFYGRTLAGVHEQLIVQKQLLAKVRAILPGALAEHALHCVVSGKKLLIYTDSAVWATQLRFYLPKIQADESTLARAPVESVQIKVLTMQTGLAKTPKRKTKIPSAETIAIIHKDCECLDDDPLKFALLKLSATLKRLSDHSDFLV